MSLSQCLQDMPLGLIVSRKRSQACQTELGKHKGIGILRGRESFQQKHLLADLTGCIAGFGDKKTEAKVPALVEALKQNIGHPLKLDVQRGKSSHSLAITAVEARNSYIESV